MGRADYYRNGSWNVICDICGEKRKAHELRKTWDGFMACRDGCWYERNPQDFVKGVPDRQAVPWSRPEPTDSFVTVQPRGFFQMTDGSFLTMTDGFDSLELRWMSP